MGHPQGSGDSRSGPQAARRLCRLGRLDANVLWMDDVQPLLGSLPATFTTREAAVAGLSRHVAERLVRVGALIRVQRGLYRRPGGDDSEARWLSIERDHLIRTAAALHVHPHHAISHVTNALARGWPVRLHPEAPVNLTAITVQPRSRRVADRYRHHSDSVINDIEFVTGMPALTAARTVADCLRTMKSPSGVAVADAALRRDTSHKEVEEALAAQTRWVGRPRARAALALVDPRRESWLESFSFVRLWERGVELPTPQVEVYDEFGRFVARVDGMWIPQGTLAECDGQGKYLQSTPDWAATAPDAAAERVVAERGRERRLLDLGLEVVRWDSQEIQRDLDYVVRRVGHARTRGDLRRFRGRLRVGGIWVEGLP